MPITKGPWAYDESTHHIVSTVEFEEWSRDIEDEPPIPMRVICTYGAMGKNNRENLALMIASPQLLEALKQWKCPACGGKGTYLHRGWRDPKGNRPVGPIKAAGKFYNEEIPCTKCEGTGRHPIAHAAIQLAEGTPLKI